jgi:hypothetical protein
MIDLLANLGKLATGFLGILVPFVILIVLLRMRDRREAALWATVLPELNLPDLRGLFSVKIKSRPFGRDAVMVELWGCSREQVWDLMERLSKRLPARVRVVVNGISDCRLNSIWTLTVTKNLPTAYCNG